MLKDDELKDVSGGQLVEKWEGLVRYCAYNCKRNGRGFDDFNKQSGNSPLFIWEMKALFLLCGRCLKNQKEGNVIYRLYSDFL